jgi:hypothetical protein
MGKKGRRIFSGFLLIFILFSFLPASGSKGNVQAQNRSSSISGRVTDGTGVGLAGVTVYADPKFRTFIPLVSGSGSSTTSTNTGVVTTATSYQFSAITDAEGYYTIDAIPGGTFILQVDLPGVTFIPENREITSETVGSQDFDLYVSDPVITPETVVLTDLSNQYLDGDGYDGSTFTFTQMTSELEEVDVADIIVSGPSTVDSDGYLRKVLNVTDAGVGVVFTTQPATLEEVIQDGSVFTMETLAPEEVTSSQSLPGVTMLPTQDRTPLTFYYEVEDVVLYDDDGDYGTEDDQIRANGSIEFELEFVFYLDMQMFQVRRFSMTQENTMRDTLEIFTEIELASLEEEKILSTEVFSPITLWAGPVPIVFVPKLDLVVGVDGSVKVGISTEVVHEFSMRAGIQYHYSSGWSPIAEISNSFTYTPPHLTFEMTLKGYFGARFNLYLYGAAGPYVKVTPYLEIKVEPLESPWWTLYGGIDVPVGFRVIDQLAKILDLDEYEVVAIGVKKIIAQAESVNQALNNSFEMGSGELPLGWQPMGGATYIWSSSEAHSGDRSVCIKNMEANTSGGWIPNSWLDVSPGEEFRTGIWVKGNSNLEAYLMIAPLDESGKWLTGSAIRIPYNDTTWSYDEFVYYVPENASYVSFEIGYNNPGGFSSKEICFDDLLWEEISQTGNNK